MFASKVGPLEFHVIVGVAAIPGKPRLNVPDRRLTVSRCTSLPEPSVPAATAGVPTGALIVMSSGILA
jgi:hypothetical protein